MPRRRGDGPGHPRARRKAQEAAVRGLVADVVTKAHEAHAVARRDLTGSARAFLNETSLPAVRALNRAGAPMLLPAMHPIVNAVQPGLISPEAVLYGHWMEWHESNRSGRPLSMGDTLQLTGARSAVSLRSSAPALPHALRTRYPGDAAPYLNQARATYRGGVSELDAVLHLLHPPDEDLEVGQITVFAEGAEEAPARPRLTNPVYNCTRPTPPVRHRMRGVLQGAHLVPCPPAGDACALRLGQPRSAPPPLQNQGCPPQGAGPLARVPWHPPAPPPRRDPRGPGTGPGDHRHPRLWGSTRSPPPPPGARGAGRGTHLPANTGGHRRYGGPPSAAPPDTGRRPPGAQGPGPRPRLGAVARRVGRVAPPPPLPMPMDDRRPPPVQG